MILLIKINKTYLYLLQLCFYYCNFSKCVFVLKIIYKLLFLNESKKWKIHKYINSTFKLEYKLRGIIY